MYPLLILLSQTHGQMYRHTTMYYSSTRYTAYTCQSKSHRPIQFKDSLTQATPSTTLCLTYVAPLADTALATTSTPLCIMVDKTLLI